MSILDSLAAEIENLRHSPHIEVLFHKSKLAPGDQDLGEDLEAIVGFKLPPSVIDAAQIDDDLHVYWKSAVHPEDNAVFGEFFLRSVLLFAASNQLNEIFLSRRYKAIADMRKMRVFDYYAHNGGPIYSLLHVIDGRLDDRVYVFNERDVFSTTLNYGSYLSALRLTRGFLFWQYLFCEDVTIEEYELAAIKRGLAFVEKEFPRDNFHEVREKLHALERGRRS